MRLRFLLPWALLLAVSSSAQAVELTGTVYTGGTPSANLAFTVEGLTDPVRTDGSGRYKVDLAPGKHVLIIKGQRIEVTVGKERTNQDIRL